MKAFVSLFTALFFTLSTVSCNFISFNKEAINAALNGEIIEASDGLSVQEYSVEDFNRLTSSISCDIYYSNGPTKVIIEGPSNLLEHIVVVNDNGNLQIKSDGFRRINFRHMKATISSPCINDVVINGAADFYAKEPISSESLSLKVNGAGDVRINGLKAMRVDVKISGSGDCKIADLDCENVSMSISGAGDCIVSGHANEAAHIKVSGAGDIHIKDFDAPKLETVVHGAGTIYRK